MTIKPPSEGELKLLSTFLKEDEFELLNLYISLLFDYNQKFNLIGKNTYENFWTRHILDGLQLVNFLSKDSPVIDLGSGNGIPGILMGMAGFDTFLVEKSKVKSNFLKNVIDKLKIKNVKIINEDIRNINLNKIKHFNRLQIISRGFKNLSETINLLDNLNVLGLKLKLMLLKGENFQREIDELKAKKLYNFDIKIFDSITRNGRVVVLNNIKKYDNKKNS